MKKIIFTLLISLFFASCSSDDDKVELPKQKEGYNPVLGKWIEKSSFHDESDHTYIWSKSFTEEYTYNVVTTKGEEQIANLTYRYAIDEQKIYFDDGSSYTWKISNDTLYMDRVNSNHRTSISAKEN